VLDILDEIVGRRRDDYLRFGPTFGSTIPETRLRAPVPFLSAGGVILEIKRASPSKGDIAPYLDPVRLARQYEAAGARNISVLTERRFFKGGLEDLVAASAACPNVSFLRKDFLLYEDEIEIAWRAGADAVLLIARILDRALLLKMAARARSFGMTAFIEVRESDDVPKLEAAAKAVAKTGAKVDAKSDAILAGVNARDLATFQIDPLVPAAMRSRLPCKAVFESGASTPEACAFARRLGFDGILIGEAAARDPEAASSFVDSFASARPDWVGQFWREIARRAISRGAISRGDTARRRPLVKICGLTNAEDALLAADLGADLLGFVFAPSPRAASFDVVRDVAERLSQKHSKAGARERPLLVGVIVDPDSKEAASAFRLALEGTLDAIQYQGDAGLAGLKRIEKEGGSYGFGRYAVVRVASGEDVERLRELAARGEPRALVDARVEGLAGGTGRTVAEALAAKAAEVSPLWLAGGLNPRNIRFVIERLGPELIDASSGLESSPGKKDPALLEEFFREIA
jgi:indole-3-glycerol phosphate synthase/phosphoribosylanthranilate isomerase